MKIHDHTKGLTENFENFLKNQTVFPKIMPGLWKRGLSPQRIHL